MAERLRAARGLAGLSVRVAAESLEVNVNSVVNWESGMLPHADNRAKLAALYGRDEDDLFAEYQMVIAVMTGKLGELTARLGTYSDEVGRRVETLESVQHRQGKALDEVVERLATVEEVVEPLVRRVDRLEAARRKKEERAEENFVRRVAAALMGRVKELSERVAAVEELSEQMTVRVESAHSTPEVEVEEGEPEELAERVDFLESRLDSINQALDDHTEEKSWPTGIAHAVPSKVYIEADGFTEVYDDTAETVVERISALERRIHAMTDALVGANEGSQP